MNMHPRFAYPAPAAPKPRNRLGLWLAAALLVALAVCYAIGASAPAPPDRSPPFSGAVSTGDNDAARCGDKTICGADHAGGVASLRCSGYAGVYSLIAIDGDATAHVYRNAKVQAMCARLGDGADPIADLSTR